MAQELNKFRLLSPEEILSIYPIVFEKIFKIKPEQQIPRTVLVDERDGEIIGFISGYLLDKENFYMSWAGHTSGYKNSRRCFEEMEGLMRIAGIKYFQSCIENTNVITQRLLLGTGWIPYGVKATQGKLFVDYYKEL